MAAAESTIPQELVSLVSDLLDKTGNMFEKRNVKKLINQFHAVENSEKRLESKDFKSVLVQLFPEPDGEHIREILSNDFFLQRCFDIIGSYRPSISIEDLLKGIAVMFSGEQDDLVYFHFRIYDVLNNHQISQEEMSEVLHSFYTTKLKLLEEELEKEVTEEEVLKEKKAHVQSKLRLGHEKIKEFIASTFQLAELNTEGAISFPEFSTAFLKHPDLFDWDEITGDLLDAVEEALTQEVHPSSATVSEGQSPFARRTHPSAPAADATGTRSPSAPTLRSSASSLPPVPSHPEERAVLEAQAQ